MHRGVAAAHRLFERVGVAHVAQDDLERVLNVRI